MVVFWHRISCLIGGFSWACLKRAWGRSYILQDPVSSLEMGHHHQAWLTKSWNVILADSWVMFKSRIFNNLYLRIWGSRIVSEVEQLLVEFKTPLGRDPRIGAHLFFRLVSRMDSPIDLYQTSETENGIGFPSLLPFRWPQSVKWATEDRFLCFSHLNPSDDPRIKTLFSIRLVLIKILIPSMTTNCLRTKMCLWVGFAPDQNYVTEVEQRWIKQGGFSSRQPAPVWLFLINCDIVKHRGTACSEYFHWRKDCGGEKTFNVPIISGSNT